MAIAIEKLRPELLTKTDAELERLAAEIAMAQAEKKRRADIAAKEELAAEANVRIDAVVSGVKWLHDNGLLPGKITAGFSGSSGAFMPASFLRNVTAESLVPGATRKSPKDPDTPKRFRRRKDPKTGEYIPSKAARKAGVA